MYNPLSWKDINLMEGTYIPSTRKTINNKAFDFWERALFQRAMYSIKCDIPWNGTVKDFFYWTLFRRGYVAVFDDDKVGLAFQPCNLGGRTFYYQPAYALINNPLFVKDKKLEIGYGDMSYAPEFDGSCEILKLTPDFMGIWDIISYYAEILAEMKLSIDMSVVNTRFAYVIAAKTRAAAQSLKKVFDKINSGESTIIIDGKLVEDEEGSTPFQFLERTALKNGYLTTDLLSDFHTVLNMFDREIGIPTVPYEKKERMVTSEAESTQVESMSRLTVWIDTLNESAELINNHFGTQLKFEKRFDDQDGGVKDESE